MQKLVSSPKSKPRIGRPPKVAAIKDHWITFRVTAEENFHLADKASRSGLSSPADYARHRALQGIARKPKSTQPLPPVFGEATRELYHELRKQGVNINQIAHHCNMHDVPPPPELVELAALLTALWRKLA